MKRILVVAVSTLALLAALTAASGAAHAGMPCAPREDLRADLAQRFGEVPAARGIVGDHHIIEVFAAPSGSFTIVVTRPDGLSCVMAAGESWQNVASPSTRNGA